MFKWKLFKSKWLAIGYLIFVSFLFCIPGSSLPKENWFSRIYLDKWIHVGIFAGLVFLYRSAFDLKAKNYNLLLLFLSFLYGILIEIIQQQWVPNRAFDLYDILADMIGGILGLTVWLWVYKKNRPL